MVTRSLHVLSRDRRRFGPGTTHKNVLSRIWRHVLVSSITRTTILLDWTRVQSHKSTLKTKKKVLKTRTRVHTKQFHHLHVVAATTNPWKATRRCALGKYVMSTLDSILTFTGVTSMVVASIMSTIPSCLKRSQAEQFVQCKLTFFYPGIIHPFGVRPYNHTHIRRQTFPRLSQKSTTTVNVSCPAVTTLRRICSTNSLSCISHLK